MNPKFIEFNGKHPAAPKDERVYCDHPRKSWKSYGASYRFGIAKLDIDDYDHKTGELIEAIRLIMLSRQNTENKSFFSFRPIWSESIKSTGIVL